MNTLSGSKEKTSAKARTAAADPAGDWLCAWCLHRIANDRDRFSYEGRDEFVFKSGTQQSPYEHPLG
jgi:hypothetical protein